MNAKNLILMVICTSPFLISCAVKKGITLKPDNLKQEKTVKIENGNLTAVLVDNSESGPIHRAGYNGIAELYHAGMDSNIFVPFYAGFNLEHIFAGDSLAELFEPRMHPMLLFRKSENEVLLYQPATPVSGVESLTEFKFTPPDYIDITFRCILHNVQFFQHGYAGFFWASYINTPADKKIYFRGIDGKDPVVRWIAAYSEQHGVKSTHKSISDNNDFYFAENYNATLASHFSEFRYELPYYYGRYDKMVLAYFFDSREIIRFSQSPTGGGNNNPAWDFQYLIPSPKAGKEYSFRARMVYRPFTSEKDIADEFAKWRAR